MTIDRDHLQRLLRCEQERFEREHPRSKALAARARGSLPGGVPMNWMLRWPGAFPVFVSEGSGASFTDVDGHTYLDLCLGDSGAMAGHAPMASVSAAIDRLRRGTLRGAAVLAP